MRISFFHILLTIALLIGNDLSAQVQPPDFLCVRNDTLRWELPVNNCGPFNAYRILSSMDRNGPYELLTTVTDQNQTAFVHAAAGAQTWYYYLESDYDCPGETVLSSDTLDNRIPDSGPIQLVSVEEGGVVVNWTLSPSPEVIGYIVSRQNANGTTILDTVFDASTYVDIGASPDTRPETYFVVALDACGNVSLVPDPHRTVFLTIDSDDACTQTIDIQWSDYINWPNGVARYEILAAEQLPGESEPGPASVIGTTDGSTTNFAAPNIIYDTRTYCFQIRAIAEVTGDTSHSNIACMLTENLPSLRDLTLLSTTVQADGVDIQWIVEPPDFNLQNGMLRRTPTGAIGDAVAVDILSQTYDDEAEAANRGPVTYQLQAVNECGAERLSGRLTTIFLTAEVTDDGAHALQWTPFQSDDGRLLNYEIFRVSRSGMEELIATYAGGELSHVDRINVDDPEQTASCYYVVANADIELSDRTVAAASVSNTICLEQAGTLYIPNAFAPTGINREFKPFLSFGQIADYTLTIYDRYGGQVFQSQDFEQGWDGRSGGQAAPQGVYIYVIEFALSDGTPVRRTGGVTLIR